MPIARNPAQHNYHWIPREAETEFQNLLKDGKAYVLPLVGVGGAGKTSLLRRFFSYCERNEIPALYIDLPRLIVSGALDMWLRVETIHTKAFDEHRKKLNTSYETLSAMLQPYGDNASGAAELLQKGVGKDENYGLAVSAIRDAGKLVYEFWQRRENQQQQELLQKPEETLLRALTKDFQKHGVILIDTLEQAGKQNLSTRLRFRDDGELETPAAEHPRTANLIEYCAGMAHFLFDKPVIMVLAGRPPAIRELGGLPLDYFAPTVDVPAFTADEIRTYLESSLPRQIAPPQNSDISKLQQLTLGNPFLLERVVRLLADWQPMWEWKAEQWQPLLNSFQQDERHGLLLYVTQRLLTHVLPDDRAFWRLALPRQYIHRDMAELLFPKDEFGDQSGLQRLKTYEEKGTVYREQDPDLYLLHDETRAAFTAWAKREKVWLDKAALEIHARLATWLDQKSGWPDEYPNPTTKIPHNDNPLLLEGAYHSFMSDTNFAQKGKELNKEEFWIMVAGSLYRPNAWKRQRIERLSKEESISCPEMLQDDRNICITRDIHSTANFKNAYASGKSSQLIKINNKDYDRAYELYKQLIGTNPKDATWIGNFAVFMQDIRKNFDYAELLYQQAIDADSKHANNLGNFALFIYNVRKDFDRAETLYQQAIDADPKHARNLGNFAIFLHVYRKDYPQAKQLYRRALEIEPDDANNMANLAQLYLMEGNKTQGKTLIAQAFATNPEAAALKLELWFYRLAHFPQDYPQAQAEIMALLETGARSEGWNFSGNITQAEKDGHQNIALLRTLADTISGRTSEPQASIL